MRQLQILLLALVAVSNVCIGQDEYKNPAYGIEVKTVGDWKIKDSSKLEIDLHSLSDSQLSELLHDKTIVSIKKEPGQSKPNFVQPFLSIKISPATSYKGKTALEIAESFQRGAVARKETIIEAATETSVGEIPAATLVTQRVFNKRTFTTHRYLIQRPRTFVMIYLMLESPVNEDDLNELKEMVSMIKIDVNADKKSIE